MIPAPLSAPWYRNPVAVMGYLAQVVGLVMAVASVVVTLPGLPPGVVTWAGVVLAVGSKVGLDLHSAQVRGAELDAAARLALQAAATPATAPAGGPSG